MGYPIWKFYNKSVIRFGKHKGKTVEEILKIAPSYITNFCLLQVENFCLSQETLNLIKESYPNIKLSEEAIKQQNIKASLWNESLTKDEYDHYNEIEIQQLEQEWEKEMLDYEYQSHIESIVEEEEDLIYDTNIVPEEYMYEEQQIGEIEDQFINGEDFPDEEDFKNPTK